jgi:AraC-like DNA-binding protein
LSAGNDNVRRERLSPAISYLIEHLTGDLDCSVLADLCHLSSSQFYNLFREEYKTSPLAYRDTLIIAKAKMLLQDMFSVTAVAEMLGFESVSYFSRFFKKHCNIPPLKYQRSKISGTAF